jgi:hypothetical protein
MDPEQLREFEENLRRINEMLGQQTALQAGILKQMQSQTSSMAQNTAATNNSTTSTNGLTNAQTGATKAVLAAQQAEEKATEAANAMRQAFDSTTGSLKSFTSAMVSGEKGFTKYGDGVKGLGDAAFSVGRQFGILGTVVGGAAAGLSRLVALQFEQFDAQVKFKDEISKMGGIGAGTTAELSALAKQAGYSYMDLQKLSKPLQTAREGLQVLGGTVGEGTKTFLEMANVGKETRMQFERLGVSQEELTNMQGQYLQLQRLSGAALRDETKDRAKLKQNSLEYAENLIKLSALTGKSAEALAQEQQQAQLQFEELVKTRQENAAIARLEATGRKEDLEKAAGLKDEQKARKQFINDMTARVGPEMAQQLAKVARTGTFDESTKGLANLGISAQQLSADLKNAKPGKETEDLILRTQTDINKKFDQKAESLGMALQLGGENLGKDFGITQQALDRTTGQQGKTAEELDKIAKDAIIKAKTAGTDKDLDKRGALTEAEIAAKKAVDSLAGAMDYTKIATYALAAAAIAASLALAKIGASGLTDMFKKGGKTPKGSPRARDAKGRFTKAPPPSRFAKATGALGKMARPLGRVLGGASKFIPGVGAVIAGGMAVSDAVAGYRNAGENLGIKGREATTGEKLSSAAGGALSGLTFGLISPETISKSIAKATGAGPSSTDAAKEAQKKHAAQMAATDKSKEKTEASIVTTSEKIDADKKTIDQTKELQETNKLREESAKASYNSLSRALSNAIDKLDIFSTSLQLLSTTINGLGGGGTSPFGPAPDGSGSPSGAGSAPANISSYMATTAMLESGGNANARAKTSSAGGMFQFLDGTWKQLTKEMGKNYSLEDKFDPRKAAEVMAYFTQKNKKQLEKSTGRPASNTDLYMAHFLGAGGASKFLNAMGRNPNALAADMDPKAARANKSIYYDESGKPRTLREVYDFMGSKYNKQAQVVAAGKAPKFVQEMAAAGGMKPGGGEGAGPSGDLAGYFNFRSPSGDETDFRGMNGALQNALMLAAQDYKSQTGKKLTINSAKRSAEDGQRLWDETVKRGTPGRGPTGDLVAKPGRSPHERGVGVDIQEYGDPRALAALSRAGLHRPYGMKDKVHFELQAMDGGIFDGPKTGYPVQMHGTELVAPLNANSILMEMAKTPANATTEESTKPVTRTNDTSEKVMNMNAEMLAMLSDKLDTMIEALENGNDTSNKLLKASRV